MVDSPKWDSKFAKYLLGAGAIFFAIGLSPYSRSGSEVWLTDFVKQGPEYVAGLTLIQMGLMGAGLSLVSYALYHERVMA
jgi:hypothetical protein